ncbi:MAG TPA: pirin family protein [Chitinophagaceae bacterium]|nr:pirin family protein [Chitinophagaceae bacterium]
MSTKKVQQVLAPPPAHMVGDGFRVHNFFPSGYNISNRRMSPFFMLDYNSKIEFSPREIPRGVGVHPHRGFETVTIAYHGKVAHGDSYGNSGVIGEGEVQWMTAASGILHKEYHEEEFSKTGGLFQMVQLWVNLPAKDKMSTPKYQGITKEMMGRYELPDGKGGVEIIAGSYEGVQGPAFTFTPIQMYNLRLHKGASLTLDFPETDNTGLLMIEGRALVNEDTVQQDHFALMANEGTSFTVEALEDAIILVLSGTPINEPIANYGPFLMNTTEELQEAIKDFNTGKFGTLED